MALAHKAFRLHAMSYLKSPDGFSWTLFHKQNKNVKKSLPCEDPTRGARETLFTNRHGHSCLSRQIQCLNSWFGVRDFTCQGGVNLRTLSWRKPHFVVSSGPKLIHGLKLIFNSKKSRTLQTMILQKSQISPLYRKTLQPCVGKKNLLPEICDR